jgi:hypothetical protein
MLAIESDAFCVVEREFMGAVVCDGRLEFGGDAGEKRLEAGALTVGKADERKI